MTQMLQRMDQIANRARDMSRQMAQQATQARAQTRDQLQILQQLCDGVEAQARETRRTMDRVQLLVQDQTLLQDRDMQQDMDRLRLHSGAVGDGLEQMLGVLDRIQQRLGR